MRLSGLHEWRSIVSARHERNTAPLLLNCRLHNYGSSKNVSLSKEFRVPSWLISCSLLCCCNSFLEFWFPWGPWGPIFLSRLILEAGSFFSFSLEDSYSLVERNPLPPSSWRKCQVPLASSLEALRSWFFSFQKGGGEEQKNDVVSLSPILASAFALCPTKKTQFKNRGWGGLLKKNVGPLSWSAFVDNFRGRWAGLAVRCPKRFHRSSRGDPLRPKLC